MSKDMEGKVVAVTGGASGMGFATAKLLLERGATVSIADVSPHLETAAVELGRSSRVDVTNAVYAHQVDVRNLDDVTRWLEATVQQFGRLDGAVNAAGIFNYHCPGVLWHQDGGMETWDQVIGVNLTGVANCLHAELGIMTSAESRAGHWGKSVVSISSVAGFRGIGGSPAYAASKHGVLGITKALAVQYAPVGVRINAVCPGMIRTPMTDKLVDSMGEEALQRFVAANPQPRMAEPEEVAKMIAFLLSDESSYITGSAHVVDGGMTA